MVKACIPVSFSHFSCDRYQYVPKKPSPGDAISVNGNTLFCFAMGANLFGTPLPNPTGGGGAIAPYPKTDGGGPNAGPHAGGGQGGGGQHIATAGGQQRGPHRTWSSTESTTRKGRAITPATTRTAPERIIARGLGRQSGGGQHAGGGQGGGGHSTGGPHMGGGHTGPPASPELSVPSTQHSATDIAIILILFMIS